MGAKAVTIQGNSVAEAIAEFANKNNITKIVVGKPQRKKWLNLFQPSIVNQIIGKSERFDVHIVSGRAETVKRDVPTKREVFISNWLDYVQGLGLLVLATLLGYLVRDSFSPTNIIMIYLLCVAVTAVFWGRGPSIMVSILALLAFDFFFVPPALSFYLADAQYLFTFMALILVGIMVSYLTSRSRQQTESARRRERQTAALYALSRDLAVSIDLESYIRAIIKRTKETFALDTVIFLPDVQNIGKLKPYTNSPSITVGGNESAAALWCFQHQKVVGHGTDTLPDAKARYLPMITARGAVGVLAIWAADTTGEINADQERILGAYADLAAVAIEGIRLAKEHHGA
jgi:two-component system sensor histidine kinase KdpD